MNAAAALPMLKVHLLADKAICHHVHSLSESNDTSLHEAVITDSVNENQTEAPKGMPD